MHKASSPETKSCRTKDEGPRGTEILSLSLGIGYVYLVFELEKSVRALLQACSHDPLSPDGLSEYYFKMSSRRMRCKEVSEHCEFLGPATGLRGQFPWGGRTLLRQEAPPASQQIQQNTPNSIFFKKRRK